MLNVLIFNNNRNHHILKSWWGTYKGIDAKGDYKLQFVGPT